MKFSGIQKLTLLDYPEKVACTLFLGGCNLRCPFCHNGGLVTAPDHAIDEDEILAFLQKRVGMLDGVCITGGEPLLQPDLDNFIAKVKAMGYAVKLDTNGCFPRQLQNLLESNSLDYVAMDIKNSPNSYAKTVGVPDFDVSPVEQSIGLLMTWNIPFEFRTTVVEEFHTAQDFREISQWIKGAPRYFLQNFVDSGDLLSPGLHPHSPEKMQAFADICRETIPNTSIRGL